MVGNRIEFLIFLPKAMVMGLHNNYNPPGNLLKLIICIELLSIVEHIPQKATIKLINIHPIVMKMLMLKIPTKHILFKKN